MKNDKSAFIASSAPAEQKKDIGKHNLELADHRLLAVTGVRAVPTFTDKSITVQLDGETLLVGGHDLAVKNLDVDSGRLTVTGYVSSLKYTGSQEPTAFLKKVFK